MKILLVRPKPHQDSIGLQSFMTCEPLEFEYISSYLESFGHEVIIIDMIFERKPLQYFLNKFQPQVVGFTAYITHVGVIKEYAKTVKHFNSQLITVVGGVHAEVVPDDFEDLNIDYIIKVNALKTFKELIDNIKRPVLENRELIQGVWKDDSKKYQLDLSFKYPHPNRDSTKKYRKKYHYIYHRKCATVKASFGCPYKCEFCFCVKITQNKYFERDIEDVVMEIKAIKENNIFIVDDNFLLNRERILKFCSLLEEYQITKKYILFGRADFVAANEDIISRLANNGLQAVFVGIESFTDDELNDYDKQTNVDMNIKAINILERHGVQCYSGIIVGLDWEVKDFDLLIKWLNSFKYPAAVNIQPITPMPGTALYESLKDELIISRSNYELWDMAHLVLKPSKMPIADYYQQIVRSYLLTSANLRSHFYILKKYGLFNYLRVSYGAFYVYRQYRKLIKMNRVK